MCRALLGDEVVDAGDVGGFDGDAVHDAVRDGGVLIGKKALDCAFHSLYCAKAVEPAHAFNGPLGYLARVDVNVSVDYGHYCPL